MKKRVLALGLSVVMTVSMSFGYVMGMESTESVDTVFVDMPDDWSTEALEKAVNNGLLSGYNNKIMPKEHLTRAQLATIINRAFGSTEMAGLGGFSDISSRAWHYEEMRKAVMMGTFQSSDGKLRPDDAATREEVFTSLATVFGLTGADQTVLDRFEDSHQISQWAKDGMASMVAAGYVQGSGASVNPKSQITRAEFAKVMDNMVKTYICEGAVYSANLQGNLLINAPDVTLENMTINGDLIIGDGVGDGRLTLKDVTVLGRTIIRGGSTGISIEGTSILGDVIHEQVTGESVISLAEEATTGEVLLRGKSDVTLSGGYGSIRALAPFLHVELMDADVHQFYAEGEGVNLSLVSAAAVDSIMSIGASVAVKVGTGTSVSSINVYGEQGVIEGRGQVNNVYAYASNLVVQTGKTLVQAASYVANILFNGNKVAPGSIVGEQAIDDLPVPASSPSSSNGSDASSIGVTSVTLTSSSDTISTHQGTLQLTVSVLPANADDNSVTWQVVNGTGFATIDDHGLLTAVQNGQVTVKVQSNENPSAQSSKVITIEGQLSNVNTIEDLKLDGHTIGGFSPAIEDYTYSLDRFATSPPALTIKLMDDKASYEVAEAEDVTSDESEKRTTTITVTAEDRSSIKKYRILFNRSK